MKIFASIPVEEVRGRFSTTFRHETHEVEVVRLVRYPATRYPILNRWHYEADIADHPAMCERAIRIGHQGAYRVNVIRSQNLRWKPPVFPVGVNVLEMQWPQT